MVKNFFLNVIAPWTFSPTRAARRLATAGAAHLAAALLFSFTIAWCGYVVVALCLDTRRWEFRLTDWGVTERSLAEVWQSWRHEGFPGNAAFPTLLAALIIVLLVLFVAWLYTPLTAGADGLGAAFRRSLAAVVASSGIATGLFIGMAEIPRVEPWLMNTGTSDFAFFAAFLAAAAAVISCIQWMHRASLAIAPPASAESQPPRCEGCGYDLTHLPASGVCPECGESTADSLSPDRRRLSAWETHASLRTLMGTTWRILLTPRTFYNRLRVKTPPHPARRFACHHYPLFCVAAIFWMLCDFELFEQASYRVEAYYGITIGGIAATLLAWLIHRTIAALALSVSLAQGALFDPQVAPRLIAYESAYLWAFFWFNGTLITSYMWFGDWISRALGLPPWGAAEPLAQLIGNVVLVILWLYRYDIAVKSVRWSNL